MSSRPTKREVVNRMKDVAEDKPILEENGKIYVAGKTFYRGEIVSYTSTSGKTDTYWVAGPSEDNPPGLILKNINSGRQFAVSAAAVATRVNKDPKLNTPQPPSQEPPQEAQPEQEQAEHKDPKLNTPQPPSQEPPQNTQPEQEQEEQNAPQENQTSNLRQKPLNLFQRTWNKVKPVGNIRRNIPPLAGIWYELLILLAILVHLADAFWLNFSIDNNMILTYRLLLYFVLGFFVHITLNRGWPLKLSIFEILKVSAIPLFIVPLISKILIYFSAPADIIKTIAGLILACPIWLIYIMFVRNEKRPLPPLRKGTFWLWLGNRLFTPSGWARLVFIGLGILVFFDLWMLAGTNLTDGMNSIPGLDIPDAAGGFDVQIAIEGLRTFVITSLDKFSTTITSFFKGAKTGFKDLKNQTLGSYYTGQVEQNKEQTGVFITDFHVTGKQYDSIPLVAYGYVKARSFVEGITITPSCYAQSMTNKSKIYIGKVEPSVLDNIYIEDQRGVICTFDGQSPEGQAQGMTTVGLPAGKYQVFLVLDFKFETWAYKQYYFLDRNYLVYLKTSGENVNSKLSIPQKTKTIYTNGPMMMGMDDSLEMPFTISSETNNYLPIGITLDDKPSTYGAKGEVGKIYKYTLRLPNELKIDLSSGKRPCTVENNMITTQEDENVPGYTMYTFDTINSLAGSYKTVNCNVEIPKDQVQKLLPALNAPAMISIVGTAEYDYKLSKQIAVTVEKTPGT